MNIARAVAFTFAAALGGAALAQDGAKPPVPPVAPPVAPPASDKVEKHVNKVTDAAKEVFARFDKLLYAPVKLGLKDLAGAVKMEMELPPEMEEMRSQMPAMDMAFTVKFTAPDQVKVAAKESAGGDASGMAGMMDQMKGQMTKGVASVVRFMVGVYRPADDSEYDADAKTTDGTTVLTITTYEKNVEVGTMEMTLSAEGLPAVGVATSKGKAAAPGGRATPGTRGSATQGEAGGEKVTLHFVYGKEGSLHRLDKMTVEAPGAPGVIEQTLSYVEADVGEAKVKVCHRWTMSLGEMQKFGFRFTDMSVNGKAVTLPKPEAAAPPKEDK